MKNICASVGAVPAREKKEIEEKVEEYYRMENEVVFFLKEAPEYRISAVANWGENSHGYIVGEANIYFRHILTGQRCESVWECLDGWSEQDEESNEKWETLCHRIEIYSNLEATILNGNTVEV